ncbi:type II secretion system protein [Pandoraea sp. PE-S2R-1]|uniref:type II secretion system protein n=1 Tax=Pandoraea sp. PE-S2R-1 TaxID=1986994 RepID=UPI00148230B1|nr:type 4 pilus major pilin [Pandoraea sp. PE-S2R-1]
MQVNAGALAQFKTKMTQRLNKRRQRGVTLVELAVAVAVMGLIMAGAMVGVPRLMASVKLTQELKDWQMASLAVQNAVATGRLVATGTNQADIVSAGVMDGFNRSGTDILNRFGGAVTVEGVAGGSGTFPSSGIQVTSAGYPTEQCREFAAKMMPTFATLSINGTPVKGPAITLANSMTLANARCALSTDNADPAAPVDTPATRADLEFTLAG